MRFQIKTGPRNNNLGFHTVPGAHDHRFLTVPFKVFPSDEWKRGYDGNRFFHIFCCSCTRFPLHKLQVLQARCLV